jgi:hypothetical protein
MSTVTKIIANDPLETLAPSYPFPIMTTLGFRPTPKSSQRHNAPWKNTEQVHEPLGSSLAPALSTTNWNLH